MGRKAIFGVPMTVNERLARSRSKRRAERLAATEAWWRQHWPGYDQLVHIDDLLPPNAASLDDLLELQERSRRVAAGKSPDKPDDSCRKSRRNGPKS